MDRTRNLKCDNNSLTSDYVRSWVQVLVMTSCHCESKFQNLIGPVAPKEASGIPVYRCTCGNQCLKEPRSILFIAET